MWCILGNLQTLVTTRQVQRSYNVIKAFMVPFTRCPLQLWPNANQSAPEVGVADKAEGIREIKLRWHAVIYIAIDLLPLPQINHLYPFTPFSLFFFFDPQFGGTPITEPVVRFLGMYGWEDMLVIVLTLDLGSLWSNVVVVSDRRGLYSFPVGRLPSCD